MGGVIATVCAVKHNQGGIVFLMHVLIVIVQTSRELINQEIHLFPMGWGLCFENWTGPLHCCLLLRSSSLIDEDAKS